MCIIIDANMFSNFINPKKEDMEPVRNWINKQNGKLVYSPAEKFESELKRHQKMNRQIREYSKRGKLTLINPEEVTSRMRKLEKERKLKSNDAHIIALAQVSGATLLASEDKKLQADFKNSEFIPGGKIYRYEEHKKLLTISRCS